MKIIKDNIFRQSFYFLHGITKKTQKGENAMKEYTLLFNAITDAIEELEKLKQQLIIAQQEAEEIYISGEK